MMVEERAERDKLRIIKQRQQQYTMKGTSAIIAEDRKISNYIFRTLDIITVQVKYQHSTCNEKSNQV